MNKYTGEIWPCFFAHILAMILTHSSIEQLAKIPLAWNSWVHWLFFLKLRNMSNNLFKIVISIYICKNKYFIPDTGWKFYYLETGSFLSILSQEHLLTFTKTLRLPWHENQILRLSLNVLCLSDIFWWQFTNPDPGKQGPHNT